MPIEAKRIRKSSSKGSGKIVVQSISRYFARKFDWRSVPADRRRVCCSFEEGEQLIQSLVAGGTASDANHQVVYNPLGFTRDAVIKVDIPAIQEDYLTQRTEDGCLLVKVPQVPSLGLRPLTLRRLSQNQ